MGRVSNAMRVLVTGAKGQLGYDVVLALTERNITCLAVDREDFDITDRAATMAAVSFHRPDAVVHCAAFTAVDRAEDEPELCHAVNVIGTRNVAEASNAVGAKLLYVSTDYVFDGTGNKPWEVHDTPNPINTYGLSKWQGEEAVRAETGKHFIVRIAWVFGVNGTNFVKTMLRLAERGEVGVVSDQVGSPTYTKDVARLFCDMIVSEQYGTYHATNAGYCSWYEFAREIFRVANVAVRTNPLTTSQYPTKARRPLNSRLSNACLAEAGLVKLPSWMDALERFIKTLQ